MSSVNIGGKSYDTSGLSNLKQPMVPTSFDSNIGNNMDWLGAASGLASSLIGGIFNYSAQKNAQKLQKQMFNEQLDFNDFWNSKQYNASNYWKSFDYYYNSPTQQVARLRDAGLNPSLMMGQLSPGGSSAPPPSPSMSAPSAPNIQPATGLGEGVGNAVNSALAAEQAAFMREQAHNMSIRNITQLTRDMKELEVQESTRKSINANTDLTKFNKFKEQELLPFLREQLRYSARSLEKNSYLADAQYYGQLIDNNLKPLFYELENRKVGASEEKNRIDALDSLRRFKVGMEANAIQNKLSDSQVALNTSMKQYWDQQGIKSEYSNTHGITLYVPTGRHIKGKREVQKLDIPLSLLNEMSGLITANSNSWKSQQDVKAAFDNINLKRHLGEEFLSVQKKRLYLDAFNGMWNNWNNSVKNGVDLVGKFSPFGKGGSSAPFTVPQSTPSAPTMPIYY